MRPSSHKLSVGSKLNDATTGLIITGPLIDGRTTGQPIADPYSQYASQYAMIVYMGSYFRTPHVRISCIDGAMQGLTTVHQAFSFLRMCWGGCERGLVLHPDGAN